MFMVIVLICCWFGSRICSLVIFCCELLKKIIWGTLLRIFLRVYSIDSSIFLHAKVSGCVIVRVEGMNDSTVDSFNREHVGLSPRSIRILFSP